MKDKKCKVCQTIFTPVQFAQSVCGYKCAIEHSKNLKQLKDQREWKAEKAVLRDKLKTLGQYEADAKKSFQNFDCANSLNLLTPPLVPRLYGRKKN